MSGICSALGLRSGTRKPASRLVDWSSAFPARASPGCRTWPLSCGSPPALREDIHTRCAPLAVAFLLPAVATLPAGTSRYQLVPVLVVCGCVPVLVLLALYLLYSINSYPKDGGKEKKKEVEILAPFLAVFRTFTLGVPFTRKGSFLVGFGEKTFEFVEPRRLGFLPHTTGAFYDTIMPLTEIWRI